MTAEGATDADGLTERVVNPPLATAALPGIGGALRRHPEDFFVRELPAYGADGREHAHVLLTMRKRGLTTDAALGELARHLDVPRRDLGLAGLKDKFAVTEQWITVPWTAREGLASFAHPEIHLGPATPHGNKLRRGHLRGNRFAIVVRDPIVAPAEALARARHKLAALTDAGGLENLYGPQRFGHGGRNAARGLANLAAPGKARRQRKADIVVSAGQSAIFNLYVLLRRERGLLRTVLCGDILKKTATGGLFECTDPATDQARLDAGELAITGPIFGSKTRLPSPGTDASALELEALAQAAVPQDALPRLGRKLPGTRRVIQVTPAELEIAALPEAETQTDPDSDSDAEHAAPHADGSPAPRPGPGLRICFILPPGCYATQLLRELQLP